MNKTFIIIRVIVIIIICLHLNNITYANGDRGGVHPENWRAIPPVLG